ncbi:hypothetical protein MKX01_003689 [Papaver californicum]|nr:hypothetical protein MKX01_003689 [Papaver californicum]
MGKAIIEAGVSAGLHVVPVSFGSESEAGKLWKLRRFIILCRDLTTNGKQVVAFIAAMNIMAEQFPGAFSGYSLQVMESHRASKLDTSGTAKDVINCFQKLGISYEVDQMQQIRDPKLVEMVGVPEEHLGHAFHTYYWTTEGSPKNFMNSVCHFFMVSFEFQHNVCGRSIYAEGTIDAALLLAKKVLSKADKHIHNMIGVLREGNMR